PQVNEPVVVLLLIFTQPPVAVSAATLSKPSVTGLHGPGVGTGVGVGVGVGLGTANAPIMPSNSSAPRSGAVAPPLTDPGGPGRVWLSMSVVTPTAAPADSSGEVVPFGICRSVLDTNGGANTNPIEALSFVPAAESVLV